MYETAAACRVCTRVRIVDGNFFICVCVCVCLLIDVYLCGWAARRPPPSRRYYGAAFFFMNRWGKNPSFYFISFGFLVLHLFICVKYFVPRTHTHTHQLNIYKCVRVGSAHIKMASSLCRDKSFCCARALQTYIHILFLYTFTIYIFLFEQVLLTHTPIYKEFFFSSWFCRTPQ